MTRITNNDASPFREAKGFSGQHILSQSLNSLALSPSAPLVLFVSFADEIRLALCMSTAAPSSAVTLRTIRVWLALFIVGLVLSGMTAFPLVHELDLLAAFIPASVPRPEGG